MTHIKPKIRRNSDDTVYISKYVETQIDKSSNIVTPLEKWNVIDWKLIFCTWFRAGEGRWIRSSLWSIQTRIRHSWYFFKIDKAESLQMTSGGNWMKPPSACMFYHDYALTYTPKSPPRLSPLAFQSPTHMSTDVEGNRILLKTSTQSRA